MTPQWKDPNGKERQWEVASRTTRMGEVDGVAIVAVVIGGGEAPRVLVEKQFRPPQGKYVLEVRPSPGGIRAARGWQGAAPGQQRGRGPERDACPKQCGCADASQSQDAGGGVVRSVGALRSGASAGAVVPRQVSSRNLQNTPPRGRQWSLAGAGVVTWH